MTEAHATLYDRVGGMWTDVGTADAAAHSGSEPHDLFLNLGGSGRFADLGGISGLRDRGDGRVIVAWDPDGDGLLDLAAVHANAPRLRLWENRLGTGRSFTLRLEGGARPDEPRAWTTRSGVGATVVARVGDRTITRSLTLGEGMASVSSASVLVGLGEASRADAVRVLWPSGRTTDLGEVAEGTLVRVSERGEVERAPRTRWPRLTRDRPLTLPPLPVSLLMEGPALVTTFATWCTACVEEIPKLQALSLAHPQLALLGMPVDSEESTESLTIWVEKHAPPWSLEPLHPGARDALRRWSTDALGYEAVPVTFAIDRDGHARAAWPGAPSVSDLRRALSTR